MKFAIPTLLGATLFVQGAFGVKVHEDKFKNIEAGSGAQFYGRLMDWSVWKQTPEQKAMNIPFNYVAIAEGESTAPALTMSELSSIGLPPNDQTQLLDYYENRPIIYPEEITSERGAVFDSKIQVDVPNSVNIEGLTLDDVSKIIEKADQPHIHESISKEWAQSFLPSFHGAHQLIESPEEAAYSFVLINTGSDYYSCNALNSGLSAQSSGITSVFGTYRQFMINRYTEVKDPSSISTEVLEAGATKVLKQEIIYSSNLITSSAGYVAFYENAGQKKMIVTNTIVMSDKVFLLPGVFVNGFGSNNSNSPDEVNGQIKLNASNTDIRAAHGGGCGQGLGLGVASYVYNLANNVVQELND